MLKVVFEGDIGFYIGGMKEKDLKISESKDLILATYEMVSEGLDIQALDTMVMCTPKGNINQIVGRILRKKPEDYENQPLIIDIIDHIPSMLILGFIRKRLYIQRKYEIIIKDINENQELKSQEYDYSKEIKIVKCNEGFIDSDDEKVEKEVKEKIEDEKKDALDLVEKEVKGEVKKVKGVKKEVKVTLKKKVQETNSFIDDD